MNSGIYLITNTLNGKQYVGQSLGVKKRFFRHRRAARLKLKREAFYLHNAISKHGEDNFKFEVILYATDPDYLNLMEQKVIAGFNTMAPNGYNLDSGGSVNRVLSDETKAKLKNRKSWNKGVPATEEQKRRQSIAMMGKPAPNKGIPRTEEQKAKQSFAMKGRVAWNKGIPMSDEQKNKLRLVDKSYTKTPEYRAMMSIAVKSAKSKLKE
jgi:group I intron endonuclease